MSFCSSCGENLTLNSAFCNKCGQSTSQVLSPPAVAIQPAKTAEQRFYEDQNILVTNSRLVKGNETFAMSGITSVMSFPEVPSKKGPIILGVVGGLIFLASLQSSWVAALFGAMLIGLCIWWFRSIKNIYHVRLVTASGQRDAMSSQNGQYIATIVGAINQAIIHRG
jgi:hypothetical protein